MFRRANHNNEAPTEGSAGIGGSKEGEGGRRSSWARGAILVGGVVASVALLQNAAVFSTRTGNARIVYEATGKVGSLRLGQQQQQQMSLDDLIDRAMRLEDIRRGERPSSSNASRVISARKSEVRGVEDSRVGTEGLASRKQHQHQHQHHHHHQQQQQQQDVEQVGGYVIEEEPSHVGVEVGSRLSGVGGTDLPCPGRTKGPDAGACQLPCRDGCTNAKTVCQEIPGCLGYTLNRESTWATLKGRVRWLKPASPTPNYVRCQQILRSGTDTVSHDGTWESLWCPDFILEEHYDGASTPTYVLPDSPRAVFDGQLDPSTMTCPKPVDGVLIITFQNGPSGDLCRFLSLASRFGLHVNVLGWEPRVNRRWKEFYMGSKVVTTLYMLHACRYPEDTVIIFSDTDVLIQGGMEEIKQALSRIFPEGSDKRLALATELSLEVAPNHASRFASLAPGNAVYKNLNSGGYAARADTLESFLKEVGSGRAYNTPQAKRFDGSVTELYRARLKYNSDGIPTVYHVNDQATFAEILQHDMYHGTATLDYRVNLFQSMFGRPAHSDFKLQDGKLRNHRAGTVPVFVHYNGMAKDPGHVPNPFDIKSLYRSLVEEAAPKPETDQWDVFARSVTLLDPAFRDVTRDFDAKGVCGRHVGS